MNPRKRIRRNSFLSKENPHRGGKKQSSLDEVEL